MLGNCDKITTPISSATKQWSQKQILLDDHKSLMASSSSSPPHKATPMPPADKHPLNCPRCDSSNTKFCYYNNYSLSQPRHFCKACKRYWTRGGTLRNVPVGGGCRKNKRPKRRDGISSSAAAAHPQIDLSPPSSHIQSPLFYGLPTNNPLELNFPFSSFRVSSSSSDNAGFDLHPQINGLGLGFSSNNGFHDGMSNSSASPFSTAAANNSSLFFESSSSSSTMASLLASTLQHQKFAPKDMHAAGLMAFEDPQMAGMGKQVKGEGENRLAWNPNPNPNPHPNPNPIDQINSSDPSSLLWNTTSIGAWFDPSSIGSSVPSLI